MTTELRNQSPALDRTVYVSKNAGTFDLYHRRWVLSNTTPQGVIIPNFSEFPTGQKEALLRTLAERATKYEEGTVRADIQSISAFARKFKEAEDFSEVGIDVENWIVWLTSQAKDESKRNLRTLVLNAIDLGYGFAFEEGISTLAKNFRSNRIRLHPDRFEGSRSFTESERKQLYYRLAREFHLGRIPNWVRVPTIAILITGKRPVQLAHSKFMDFSVDEISVAKKDSRKIIVYNAPVAKQKGQRFRTKFNTMPIVSSFELWDDLEAKRAENRERISQLLDIELNEEQSLLLPVFLPASDEEILQRIHLAENHGLDLDEFLASDRLHTTGQRISDLVGSINAYVTVLSEFTGRPLKINPKRFRHTLATNLALSGYSIDEIAEALDHSSRESSKVYVDNLPARAVKIGTQVEETLGFIAKSFSGTTVENSDRVIKLYTKNGTHNVGICGMEAFCNENYPIACYECELFNPNPFGNHAAVQEYVEAKLQEAKLEGDQRHIENWHTILLAVLERRYVADQQRLQILEDKPEILALEREEAADE